MSKTVNINEETYRKFQAALMLSGEEEEVVLNGLISKYAHMVFERAMKKETAEPKANSESTKRTESEQKQLFVNWFRGLTRNGKAYNPVTISGYTGRIENACADPVFETVSVKNLFAVTDVVDFVNIQNEIKNCAGYAEFDARTHNGFTAALRKYEEFLRYQASGGIGQVTPIAPQQYTRNTNVHRWTIEEDTICCKRFLECYVLRQSGMDTVQFLQMLAKEVPAVSEGSLRMKIQNVKYLAIQAGLKDTSTLKWLSQYSTQCAQAFHQAMRELNIR